MTQTLTKILVKKGNFVKLHEIGHGVLSWQNDIMLALDNDETLSEEYEEQFWRKRQIILHLLHYFNMSAFIEECEKLNLGLGAVMALEQKFGASVHSAFRNYVLQSKNRCALLVLNHPVNENGYTNIVTTKGLILFKIFP